MGNVHADTGTDAPEVCSRKGRRYDTRHVSDSDTAASDRRRGSGVHERTSAYHSHHRIRLHRPGGPCLLSCASMVVCSSIRRSQPAGCHTYSTTALLLAVWLPIPFVVSIVAPLIIFVAMVTIPESAQSWNSRFCSGPGKGDHVGSVSVLPDLVAGSSDCCHHCLREAGRCIGSRR